MDRNIIFTADADEEVEVAYFWYEEKEPGLGDRFFQSLKRALHTVLSRPDLYPVRFDQVRRIMVPKFPYWIYFEYDDRAIYVLSVFHKSQHPARLDRLRDL